MRLSLKEKSVCSVCGEKNALAVWHGMGHNIHVCHYCATEWLPALIADAVVLNSDSDAFKASEKVQSRFWRALALRLAKSLKPRS